jgi:N-acetyl-anhydromuramyl-L-alanine amidase AmpD
METRFTHRSRTRLRRFGSPLFLLSIGTALHAQTPATAPVAIPSAPAVPTAAPVAETTDATGAIWAAAATSNFQPAARPSDRPIDLIIIHDIEGGAAGTVNWFQNPRAQVSSHYVIGGAEGRVVWQMVREKDIAWHAGNKDTNAHSVGIEHEGFAYRPGFYSIGLYEASAKLVRDISTRNQIPRDRAHIIGHFEVPSTRTPGAFGGASGHTDPGPYWDWDYYMALVRNDATVAPIAPASALVLHPGETAEITLTFTNTGDDPWPKPGGEAAREIREQGPVYLGVTRSDASPFYQPSWVSPRYLAVAPDTTAPGGTAQFTVKLPAPRTLGTVTETFRLTKVPPMPRVPVPFGAAATLNVRVEPWEIDKVAATDAEFTAPGWGTKAMPGGKVFWRKPAKAVTTAPAEWKATLPMDGLWDVMVRVPAGKGRVARAVYEVRTPDGVRRFALNQQQGGGQWRRLARLPFTGKTPVASVRLLAVGKPSEGVLVADTVRFVGPYPAEPTGSAPAK